MLNVLSTLFGPHRAVSIYVFLKTWGFVILGGLIMVALVTSLFVLGDDGEHEHDAFLTVAVLSATPINGDTRNGAIASVRLPDGSATSITTTDSLIAQSIGTSACVEKRIFVNSGEARYRLKLPKFCEAS